MRNKILSYIVVFILGVVIAFFIKSKDKEIIEVPVKFEVKVPVVKKVHDTITEFKPVPVPIKEVDTSLVEEYRKANDSLKQELFKKAVTINEYEEVFEDTIQKITVGANVTGVLNSLAVKYETKPRTITVDTIIPVKVPTIKRNINLYVETGVPTKIETTTPIIFKAGVDVIGKRGWGYGASYDTQKVVWGKLIKRFNF